MGRRAFWDSENRDRKPSLFEDSAQVVFLPVVSYERGGRLENWHHFGIGWIGVSGRVQ